MIIFGIIFLILIISIAWAFWSLNDLQKGLKTKEVIKELKQERVIFHSSDVSSSDESGS